MRIGDHDNKLTPEKTVMHIFWNIHAKDLKIHSSGQSMMGFSGEIVWTAYFTGIFNFNL